MHVVINASLSSQRWTVTLKHMVDRNSLPAMSVVACSPQKGASKYTCVCIQVCHSKLLSDIYVIKNCQLIKETLPLWILCYSYCAYSYIQYIYQPLLLLVDVLLALWSLLLRSMRRYSRNDNIWYYLHIHVQAGLVLCQGHMS